MSTHRIFQNLVLVLILLVPSAVYAGSISGTLTLPPGSYTLPTDLVFFVRATATDDSPTNDFKQRLVTFDMGDTPGTSIAFSIPDLLSDHDYTLQYDCNVFSSPEACQLIVARLYFNDTSTTDTELREENAQVFNGSATTTGLSFPIQAGTRFAGTLSLPSSELASADISFTFIARNVASPTTVTLQVSGTIASGQNSTPIEIRVPDDDGESWHLGYSCVSALDPDCADFQREGYFKNGATNNMVENYVGSDEFIGDTTQTNINLVLLDGFTISGTITTPEMVTSPNGIRLNIRARNVNDATDVFSTPVVIPQNQSSETYSITVSLDPLAEWIVSYGCDAIATPEECGKYLQQGVYDDDGTVGNSNLVDPPLAGGESHENINMTLLQGPLLSGTLSLSDGAAPFGGLNFTLRVAETSGSGTQFSQNITIEEGATQTDFAVRVSDSNMHTFRLSYNCNESLTPQCELVTDEAFYDSLTETMVAMSGEATPVVNNGMDVANLALLVESTGLLPQDICIPIKAANDGVAVICM